MDRRVDYYLVETKYMQTSSVTEDEFDFHFSVLI